MEPDFVEKHLPEYIGQKILIYKSGGKKISTNTPKSIFKKEILFGELTLPGCEKNKNGLIATIKNPFEIINNEKIKTEKEFSIEEFVETWKKRNLYDFLGHKIPSRLYVNVYHNPLNIIHSPFVYNENPCYILNVGNEIVENFLFARKIKI